MNLPVTVSGEHAISALSRVTAERTKILLCDANGVIRDMRSCLDEMIPYMLGVELPQGTRANRAAFAAISPGAALAFDDLKRSVHEMDFIYDVPSVRGAIDSLIYLRNHGWSTVVSTSRDDIEGAVFAEWIRREGDERNVDGALVDMVIACGGSPKGTVIGSLRPHAVVDDTYAKIQGVNALNRYVFGTEARSRLPSGVRGFPNGWLDNTGRPVLAERIVRDSYPSKLRLI